MSTLGLLSCLFVTLVALGLLEDRRHRAALGRIPVRIHVNGTRGKSSVTRLIAAGLRAGDVRTFAKTTGTLARVILPEGAELPVFRPAKPNVSEQIRIVRAAAATRSKALVIECMALQPYLQWLSEARFVRATHGVITNARPDHLDVMGPEEEDVAWALCGMVPYNGRLFTAEQDHLPILRAAAATRGSEVVAVGPEHAEAISDEDMAGFPYAEHKINVALALAICEDLGVARATALGGMHAASPDPGAMTEHPVDFFGRTIMFVNGFAANDPESTEQIWNLMIERHASQAKKIAVFNLRADRADRSRQLGEAYVNWRQADAVVLMGTGTYLFARAAVQGGIDPKRIVYAEDQRVDEVFETIVGLVDDSALVMGMGNIGGDGLDVVRYFRNRQAPQRRGA